MGLSRTKSRLSEVERTKAELQSQLDTILKYLKDHKAIDEYAENSRYLAELQAKAAKIEDYQKLSAKLVEDVQNIKADMANETVETSKYLKRLKPHIDGLRESYAKLAKEFYREKSAGLTVENNDGDNQIRYKIEARIEHHASDGINDVRIFCFDLLLLMLQARHNVKFIMHDSRLYSDMDPHQRLTLFRVADKVCRKHGFQYIASINYDELESVREAPLADDFDALFTKTRVLELTGGEDGSGKLLGVQIEMQYVDVKES